MSNFSKKKVFLFAKCYTKKSFSTRFLKTNRGEIFSLISGPFHGFFLDYLPTLSIIVTLFDGFFLFILLKSEKSVQGHLLKYRCSVSIINRTKSIKKFVWIKMFHELFFRAVGSEFVKMEMSKNIKNCVWAKNENSKLAILCEFLFSW